MLQSFEKAHLDYSRRNTVLQLHADDRVPVVPRDPHPLYLNPEATYLVLGGLGGLSRWLCGKLADHGARHIVSFSRSGASRQEAKDLIKDMAEWNVTLKSFVYDVGDPDAFIAAVALMEREMPPVKGAIYATMVLRDRYLEDMTSEDWSITSRNKIQGAINMHNFLPKDLDFFVLVSSISPIMGNSMQANYAAGNAFLDSLAFHRRHLGLKACAVNFGLISEVGYVAEHISSSTTHAEDLSLISISPPEVWSVMKSAMTGYMDMDVPMPPQLITCAGSGGLFRQLKRIKTHGYTSDPKYRYLNLLDAQGGDDEVADASTSKGRTELSKRLATASSFDDALAIVESALVEKVASAIPMPPEDVDPEKPGALYGVDSLVANEIRNWAVSVIKGSLVSSGSSYVRRQRKIVR
jgi:NAD(P)-dependent dehydrogenase (short-subunit alcohol dehydrogenase family)